MWLFWNSIFCFIFTAMQKYEPTKSVFIYFISMFTGIWIIFRCIGSIYYYIDFFVNKYISMKSLETSNKYKPQKKKLLEKFIEIYNAEIEFEKDEIKLV